MKSNIHNPCARLPVQRIVFHHSEHIAFDSDYYSNFNEQLGLHKCEASLCDQVTGCPARMRTTSSVSSPRCTSNTALRLTFLLNGLKALEVYIDHRNVPANSGIMRVDKIIPFLRTKIPVINIWKITIPHMSRLKVMGHACP